MASEQRCSKPGCGALKIVGKPCSDADCPQQWVRHTDTRPAPAATDTGPVTVRKEYRFPMRDKWELQPKMFGMDAVEERSLVTRSQAEELLARNIAKLSRKIIDIEADNAAITKERDFWKDRFENDTKAIRKLETENERLRQLFEDAIIHDATLTGPKLMGVNASAAVRSVRSYIETRKEGPTDDN